MQLEGKTKPFLIGASTGAIVGGVLSGFLLYFGIVLLFLLIIVAITEINLSKKFLWWGFIAGASASFVLTIAFILPLFKSL